MPGSLVELLSCVRYESLEPSYLRETVAVHPILQACGEESQHIVQAVLETAGQRQSRELSTSCSHAPSCSSGDFAPASRNAPASGTKRPRDSTTRDSTTRDSTPASQPALRRASLQGEFRTPSAVRPSVTLARASAGGLEFTFDPLSWERDGKSEGYFAWLGTRAGSREWANPAADSQVGLEVTLMCDHRFVSGQDNRFVDQHMVANRFHDKDEHDALRGIGALRGIRESTRSCRPYDEIHIKLPQRFILTGYALTQANDDCFSDDEVEEIANLGGPKSWNVSASNDGDKWKRIARKHKRTGMGPVPPKDEYGLRENTSASGTQAPQYYQIPVQSVDVAGNRFFRFKSRRHCFLSFWRIELFGSLADADAACDATEATRPKKKARAPARA